MAGEEGQTPATSGHSTESRANAEHLYKDLAALEEENRRLKEVVSVKQGKETTKCGYLFKYRPFKIGVFSNTWELRFFSLTGDVLQYYKSEKDTAFHPRGLINVANCIVEVEGKKRDRYWVFSVVDHSGLSLLRMSTENEEDSESWVQALVRAGCRKQYLNDAFRRKSPLRGADVRWKGDKSLEPSKQAASATLTRRWASQENLMAAHIERAESSAEKDAAGRPKVRDYTSDSATSEVGQSRAHALKKQRGDMRASTELYTESRPSMLSADRIAVTQHSGILNLMTLVLLVTNFRLILENLLKYGVLTNPARWIFFLAPDGNLPLFLCWPALGCFCLCALAIEKLGVTRLEAEKKVGNARRKKESPGDPRWRAARMARRTEAALALLNVTNTTLVLVVPCTAVHVTDAEPVPSFVIVIFTIVLWMKLVSYAHCNMDLRQLYRSRDHRFAADKNKGSPEHSRLGFEATQQDKEESRSSKVAYPGNITLRNLAYFLVAPTLVYQTSFPFSSRFRPRRVLLYFARLSVLLGVLVIITEQYMQPTIANSIVPLSTLEWARIFERVLKLSIPTLYGWILIFYALFHVWLNIVAELTHFGDREFYKDWWNATTIGDYWRLWNVPVHKWLLRHVYYPARRLGMSKFPAACCVFFVSAVFHEMLVGVPLHMVRFWAFVGLMFQVPLLYVTEYVKVKAKSDQIGNFVFWFTFVIFGQPMAIMLYYHDWVLLNRPEWIAALKAGRS